MRKVVAALLVLAPLLSGCEPEVGSERWCEKMEAKGRGDWTMNETADYARHCILRAREE